MSPRDLADNPRARTRVRLPFPGTRAFRRADGHLFFGRTAPTRETRARWLSDRVVVLCGPIAVGKTSLLRAGVLPAIGSKDASVLPVGRVTPRPVPGGRHRAASTFTEELLRSWKSDGRPPPRNMSVLEFMEERRGTLGAKGGSRPMLVCIDQLEELYADPSGMIAGEQFLDELSIAVEALPAVHLLLLVRQDAVQALADHKRFSELRPRYVELRPFDAAAALEAIVNPALASAMPFASGTAERLVDDLRTVTFCDSVGNISTVYRDDIEPLHVQIACRNLWATLPAKAAVITGERLRAWGGVDMAMADFYNAVASEVATDTGMNEGRLRDWLRLTFVTERGTRDIVGSGSLALARIPAAVLGALVDRRIVSAEHQDDDVWYRLSHDRLTFAVLTANRAYERAHGGDRVPGQPDARLTADALLAAAEAALRDGDLPAAERSIAEALERFQAAGNWRRIADARFLQAKVARAGGDLAGAEHRLREALSIFFTLDDRYAAARALSAAAELRFVAGDYAGAAELSRNAVERMPADATALTGLAYAQWRGGSPADAEATFGQALRWDSSTAMALAGRGQIRADLGRYECALEDLDRALRLDLTLDGEADARSARALALAGLGRVKESAAELETAVRLAPDRPRTRLRAGRIAAILGHHDEVREEIERALGGRPTLSSAERESARRILGSLR